MTTHRTLVRRILAVWERATPSDIESGATWYDDAREHANALAPSFGSLEHAAAVIAHLSPRTPWARNIALAYAIAANPEVRSVGAIGSNYRRALASLDSPDPLGISGPKTRRFAANIAGDTESVTVDVWACRVAGIDVDTLSRVGVYDAVERAYQSAARAVGVTPATMQATTWIVARNGRAS